MCSNFAIIEATKGGARSFKKFLKKLLVPRNTKANKKRNGNSDVNRTWIITNFYLCQYSCGNLFPISLLMPNALSGEVYPL